MVRHEQEEVRPPQRLCLPMTNGVKHSFGDLRQSKLILEMHFAVYGDEINCRLGINPQRSPCGKVVRCGISIAGGYDTGALHGKALVGTSRAMSPPASSGRKRIASRAHHGPVRR